MNLHRSMLAAQLMMLTACAMVGDNRHVSASGKYVIRFHEAKGELDSYYQLIEQARPDLRYSSMGGATPLNGGDVFWSPTENTCAILEKRPGTTGQEDGTGLIRILFVVNVAESAKHFQIYMRPFEALYFNDEKVEVLSISDDVLKFHSVSGRITKEFAIHTLLEESYRQDARSFRDDEILD